MKTKKTLFILILIFLCSNYYSFAKKSPVPIKDLDNSFFFIDNGNYTFLSNKEVANEINENFFREIINGNIFIILNWLDYFKIEKKSTTIKIQTYKSQYNSEVSYNFINLVFSWVSLFSKLIDNKIEIIYQNYVKIHYTTENNNTIYIKKISGIVINNKIKFSDKLRHLLDISRYKLVYKNENIFLGITNPEKEQSFEYYIYTSIEDINKRGFSNVFNQSNETIRKNLKPIVKNLF